MAKKATDFAASLLLAFLSVLALALVSPQPASCCTAGTQMEVRNGGTRAIVIDSVALVVPWGPTFGYDESLYVGPGSTVTRLYLDVIALDSAKVWYYVNPESILTTLIAPVRFSWPYWLEAVENATVVFWPVGAPEATPVGLTLAAVALALTGIWCLRRRFLRAQRGLGPTVAGTGG